MGEFELIFFVVVAGFFAYKLWAVLGRTNGDEKSRAAEIISITEKKQQPKEKPMLAKSAAAKKPIIIAEDFPEEFKAEFAEIKKIDPSFSLESFLKGAELTFETVIEAYSKGKKNRLKFLLNDEIYADFVADIDKYEANSQHAKATLVSLDEPEIVDVELNGKIAHITLEFTSEQINYVEDADGDVVEGSKSRIERTTDSWTFERNLSSHKPQWLVVGTDA